VALTPVAAQEEDICMQALSWLVAGIAFALLIEILLGIRLYRWLRRNSVGLSVFEPFTDNARRAMCLANKEACRLDHEYIGTEHILLGLAKVGSGAATEILRRHQIDYGTVRLEVERIIQRGPDMRLQDFLSGVVMGALPHTPRATKILEFSREQSRALGHAWIGTEHLLLGLLLESEGVGGTVLSNLGLDPETVRKEIVSLSA
jgi:ATP-dependent Clp protease ATP-binding subunit ClpC